MGLMNRSNKDFLKLGLPVLVVYSVVGVVIRILDDEKAPNQYCQSILLSHFDSRLSRLSTHSCL